MTEMNPMLAALYGTAGATQEYELEKNASNEDLLDYVVKTAAEIGVSMDELDDESIESIMEAGRAYLGGIEGDTVKEASEFDGDDAEIEKMAAHADFMGRVMAHSFAQESESINEELYKEASYEEDPVLARAQEILAAADVAMGGEAVEYESEKTASDLARDAVIEAMYKQAADQDLTAQALELLDAEDYDVDLITELLS